MINLVTDPLSLANELRPSLLKLARQLRREVHDLGLTAGQTTLLAQIEAHPGIGVKALAELEGVSAAWTSKATQELITRGLLLRDRGVDTGSGHDLRRIHLELSPRGRAVLRSVRKRRTALLAKRLRRLSSDELAAVEAALPALEKLAEDES